MSPKQGEQHLLLHQQWPPPLCCLCNHETELAHLHAEVERLRQEKIAKLQGAYMRIAELERERDEALHKARANAELFGKQTIRLALALADKQEALAQVAVLVHAIETSPLDSQDIQRLIAVGGLSKQTVEEARALLDRIQRAEVVVDLAANVPKYHGDIACGHGDGLGDHLIQDLVKALAAWKEGKV